MGADAAVEVLESPVARARLRIAGRVRDVGFRAFVRVLAARLGLAGWVRGDGDAILVEVEGVAIDRFLFEVGRFAPPLARIDAIEWHYCQPVGDRGFRILLELVDEPVR
jgi:hydrogenase maturation protein HypF